MDRIFSTKWRDVNCVQNFVCTSTGITLEGRNIDDGLTQYWMLNRHGCPTFVCNVAITCTKANVKKLPVRYLACIGSATLRGVKATSAVYRRKSVILLLGKCCTIISLSPWNCVVNCSVIKRSLQ